MHALVGVSPLAFVAASLLIILAPGPDMTLVARNTIARGRIAGMQTAGGALLGVSVHLFAAVAGLSAILTGSALAFTVVKVAGAAYLVFLGARTLIASRHQRESGDSNIERELFGEASPRLVLAPSSPVMQGVLSAVLNPKLAVFFLTFLPQFVDPDHLPEAGMLAHGAVFVSIAAVWLTLWVLALDRLAGVFRRSAVRVWLERATGAVLVGMGVRLALSHR
jgi:threonine/homoserine/homoserine lactone efflux protein